MFFKKKIIFNIKTSKQSENIKIKFSQNAIWKTISNRALIFIMPSGIDADQLLHV